MNTSEAKKILTNRNYKEYFLSGISGLAVLFDRGRIPEIISNNSFETKDIFGNRAKIQKSVNEIWGGYNFKVTNLDFVDFSKPDQVAGFDEPLYCLCGQEIEEAAFDSERQLQSGEMYGKCEGCGQTWRIEYKCKPTKSGVEIPMSTIYDLWELCVDVFPAIEKHLFFDEVE